jgi:charged multivesicular body protein 1
MAEQQQVIFQLKFQAKLLENQAKRELKNAERERNVAKRHLARGERALAMHHAQQAMRAQNLSTFLLENAGRVSSMVCDLQMAIVQAKTAKALAGATKEMEKYLSTMNLQKIAELTLRYDQIRGKAQTANQIMMPDDAVTQMGSESLLGDLENELLQEQLAGAIEVPAAPIFVEPSAAALQPTAG